MSPVRVNYWAEGPTDRAAARKLIEVVGGEPGDDYSGRRRALSGKDYLDDNLGRYNAAAQYAPWLVLRDADGECAKELATRLLANPAPKMRFRIVVPAIEAWLLADREAMAKFLGVDARRLPLAPEESADVKACVIELARRSSLRSVRAEMPPVPQSGRREGPGYATHLIDSTVARWQPTEGCTERRQSAPRDRKAESILACL